MLGNNLAQSDLETNPDRYIILNGSGEKTDPLLKDWEVYKKDSAAYYPYNRPNEEKTATIPQMNQEARMRYGNNPVYNLDQEPYYSPSENFRVISNMSRDRLAVPIEFGDLTRTHADEKNLRKMESDLQNIDKPQSLSNLAFSGKYMNDARAYYDPTADGKIQFKSELQNDISNMKQDLIDPQVPQFQTELFNHKLKVQNYRNKNREETNEIISNSYHYPVLKNQRGFDIAGAIGSGSKLLATDHTFDIAQGQSKTFNELVQDGSVIGVEPTNVRKPYSIVTSGTVFDNHINNAQQNSGSFNSKYTVDDEKSSVPVEIEAVGVVLGNKYVDDALVKKPVSEYQTVDNRKNENLNTKLSSAKSISDSNAYKSATIPTIGKENNVEHDAINNNKNAAKSDLTNTNNNILKVSSSETIQNTSPQKLSSTNTQATATNQSITSASKTVPSSSDSAFPKNESKRKIEKKEVKATNETKSNENSQKLLEAKLQTVNSNNTELNDQKNTNPKKLDNNIPDITNKDLGTKIVTEKSGNVDNNILKINNYINLKNDRIKNQAFSSELKTSPAEDSSNNKSIIEKNKTISADEKKKNIEINSHAETKPKPSIEPEPSESTLTQNNNDISGTNDLTEDKAKADNNSKLSEDKIKEAEVMSKKDNLNTQGLKIEKVKIIPMRKILETNKNKENNNEESQD